MRVDGPKEAAREAPGALLLREFGDRPVVDLQEIIELDEAAAHPIDVRVAMDIAPSDIG